MIKIPQTSFYFIASGETSRSKKSVDSPDAKLNDAGLAQIEAAAYELNDLELCKVYTSPLIRAVQTAEIIAGVCDLEIVKISELCAQEDNESMQAFKKRVMLSLQKVLTANEEYPLIVSHNDVLAVLAKALARKQDAVCRNGEVFIFSPSIFVPGKWDMESITHHEENSIYQ